MVQISGCWSLSWHFNFHDISKAFNTINHSALLSKLIYQFGFDGSICEWFNSYLSDKHQVVCINGACSSFQTTTSGVPQGSVPGPILFTCYINALPQRVRSASSALFADDITTYVVGTSVPKLSVSLNKALTEVHSWMTDNGLTLNVKKTECMVISTGLRAALSPLQLFYNDVNIDQVKSFKLLGVYINHHLKWSEHINDIVSKVSRQLRLMRHLVWFSLGAF